MCVTFKWGCMGLHSISFRRGHKKCVVCLDMMLGTLILRIADVYMFHSGGGSVWILERVCLVGFECRVEHI